MTNVTQLRIVNSTINAIGSKNNGTNTSHCVVVVACSNGIQNCTPSCDDDILLPGISSSGKASSSVVTHTTSSVYTKPDNAGDIIGGTIASVLGAGILITLFYFVFYRKNQKNKKKARRYTTPNS